MNKLLIILLSFFLLGCVSKKKFIDKELIGAEVTKIESTEKIVEKKEKKDSVVQKKETTSKVNQSTNVQIEFDSKNPKDSLEVTHVVGKDSLYFKATGNGKVTVIVKREQSEEIVDNKQIFGSETLFNINEKAALKRKEKSKQTIVKSTKKKDEKGFTFGAWISIGISFLIIACLVWLFIYFRKNPIRNLFKK